MTARRGGCGTIGAPAPRRASASPRPAARLVPVVGLALAAGLAPPGAPAAPVPTHLMPKDPPLAYPTRVGTTWVYDEGGGETTLVISAAEHKDEAKFVTVEQVGAGGKGTPYMVQSVSERGVFEAAGRETAFDAPVRLLGLPHREGETWTVDVRRGGRVVFTGT